MGNMKGDRPHNPLVLGSSQAYPTFFTYSLMVLKAKKLTMHTELLKSTARSSKPIGADMRGIQKITNKDGTKSYRAQVRLKDGIPQQS